MDKFKQLDEKRAEALLGGGEKRIEAQHKKGKLTARKDYTSSSMKVLSKKLALLFVIEVMILASTKTSLLAMV